MKRSATPRRPSPFVPTNFGIAVAAFCFGLTVLLGCGKDNTTPSAPSTDASASASGTGVSTADSASKPKQSPREILAETVKAYRNAKTYSDQGKVRLVAAKGDEKIDREISFSIALERPNKIRLEIYNANVVCDGKKLYATNLDCLNQIVERDAPETINLKSIYFEPILTAALTRGPAGASTQLLFLLDDNPLEYLLKDAQEPQLLDPATFDGASCNRVEITWPHGKGVLWIDEKKFVIRRIVFPTDLLREQFAADLGGKLDTLSLVAEFPNAQIDAPVDDKAFMFEIPTGAEKMKYFLPPNPAQLLGKKAPDFKFADLDGKPFTPGTISGKTTVLFFWAASQGASKASLPELQKAFESAKEDSNTLFAAVGVDASETDQQLKEVFKTQKITVPLIRDPQVTAGLFRITELPTIILIDSKGIVQDCATKVTPDLPQILAEKIKKLKAGENIFDAPLNKYKSEVKNYERDLDAAAQPETQVIPQAKIADASEPKTFRLKPLWKNDEVKIPGNVYPLPPKDGKGRFVVIDNLKSLAVIDADGKTLAVSKPSIGDQELIGNLSVCADAKGKTLAVGFLSSSQRCHIFDDQWNLTLSFPVDALEHPHAGIADARLADLDGDGAPELYVGYWGVVGLQAVSLDGKRIWTNRQLSIVSRIVTGDPDSSKRRDLICLNNGAVAAVDNQGKTRAEIAVPDRALHTIEKIERAKDDLSVWCGITRSRPEENIVVGFNLRGEELWRYELPNGLPTQPIEQILYGRLAADGPFVWVLPGADGSVHFLNLDGKKIDSFNVGRGLNGLAVASIAGKPALLVSTARGLEAFEIQPK